MIWLLKSPQSATGFRVALVAGVAIATSACANEPLGRSAAFAPAMMLNAPLEPAAAAPAADPARDLTRTSMAAKVLASRALETVTGLTTDPARLSEHD